MKLEIEIKKRHAYVISSLLVIVISIGLVAAFGGSNPSVLGHSAGELLVDGTSVVDDSLTGSDINEGTLGTVPSASSASSASSAGSVSCTDCLGSGQISESSFNWPVSSDLSCTDCIGGTEISESSLGTVPAASAFGFSSVSSADVCLNIANVAYCTAGSCGDGTCDGCGASLAGDIVLHIDGSSRITGISQLGSAACAP